MLIMFSKSSTHTIISSWELALPRTSEIIWVGNLRWLIKFCRVIFKSANVLMECQMLRDVSFPHLLLFANILRKHLVLRKVSNRHLQKYFLGSGKVKVCACVRFTKMKLSQRFIICATSNHIIY